MSNEFNDIMKIISGEMALEKKKKAIEKAKKEAVEEQKNKRRKGIEQGKVKLEKEEGVEEKKIVQNIKLFTWEAPDRVQLKHNNKSFLILVACSLAFILFLAILGHYFLMGSIIALVFLIYVLGTTKPKQVSHTITARGIDTGGRLYEWYLLKNFYFTKKDNQVFLFVETFLNFPGALIFLLEEKERGALFVLLQEKLLYKDIRKQDWLDKKNFGNYIPLEKI